MQRERRQVSIGLSREMWHIEILRMEKWHLDVGQRSAERKRKHGLVRKYGGMSGESGSIGGSNLQRLDGSGYVGYW